MRRFAIAHGILDHPIDYKKHAESTPYLGGSAVLIGFIVAAIAFGDGLGRFGTILAGTALLWIIGTLDDSKGGIGVRPRFIVQVGVAAWLWSSDLGWSLIGNSDIANLALTVFWVVGITNAANLMDNQDGASGSVIGAAAMGTGLLAVIQNDPILGALAASLAGACVGFLPHNLASPSKIFMGDGGSAPIGFILAAAVMSVPHTGLGLVSLLAAVPLVGLAGF